MKDLGLLAAGVAVYALVVFGIVAVSQESSEGSNTKNGVTVSGPLPPGIDVKANRLSSGGEYTAE